MQPSNPFHHSCDNVGVFLRTDNYMARKRGMPRRVQSIDKGDHQWRAQVHGCTDNDPKHRLPGHTAYRNLFVRPSSRYGGWPGMARPGGGTILRQHCPPSLNHYVFRADIYPGVLTRADQRVFLRDD